jgi:hypothetical protein
MWDPIQKITKSPKGLKAWLSGRAPRGKKCKLVVFLPAWFLVSNVWHFRLYLLGEALFPSGKSNYNMLRDMCIFIIFGHLWTCHVCDLVPLIKYRKFNFQALFEYFFYPLLSFIPFWNSSCKYDRQFDVVSEPSDSLFLFHQYLSRFWYKHTILIQSLVTEESGGGST